MPAAKNTAAIVLPAVATVALESLTVGQLVRVTLTNGKSFDGIVATVQNLDRTGCNVAISATGERLFALNHFVKMVGRTVTLSEAINCTRITETASGVGIKQTQFGQVSKIETLS